MTLAGKPSPKPLPDNTFVPGTLLHNAYEQCLILQRKPSWNEFVFNLKKDYSPNVMERMLPETVARVLGYALLHAPSTDGRDTLAREIMDCTTDSACVVNMDGSTSTNCSPELLAGLAYLYIYGVIRVFYNPKGPTPCISAAQSPRRSMEEAVDAASPILGPSFATTTVLRDRVLVRDNYRCVITGQYDIKQYRLLRPAGPPPSRIGDTNTAHIISQSFSTGIDGLTAEARAKFNWASTAAAVLQRFGGFSAFDILGSDNLNSPANALTLSHTPHLLFDSLDLWLLPQLDEHGEPIPDTYVVHSADYPEVTQSWNNTVSFQAVTIDEVNVPPPHPRLLALHAACAQVAHLSGAAGYLHDFFGDPDSEAPAVLTAPNALSFLTQKLNALQLVYPAAWPIRTD